MSLPQYSRYKDSGVEWLGFIPEHWHVGRLKNSVLSSKGGIWGNEESFDDNDIVCVRVADFDRSKLRAVLENPTIRNVLQSERNGRILERGDLLLEKSGGGENQLVGCVVMYKHDEQAVCSNFVARLKLAADMVSEYWCYVHFALYALRINYCSINQTSGIQNLDQDKYLNERVPYPDFSEQSAIATFLDRETAKIDALISEQERLITLLAEKRQATISHAVTKGLNPHVPMKESGVEWLGEVPEHWGVTRLKYAMSHIVDCPHDTPVYNDDGLYQVIRTADISLGRFHADSTYRVDEGEYLNRIRRLQVVKDDIVYGREGERWGFAALVPEDGFYCLGQRMMQFRSREEISANFMMWQLNAVSTYRQGQMDTVGATAPHVNVGTIRNYRLTEPPLDEQIDIADFLVKETEKLDALVSQASHGIKLLIEHRTALISAAVTGKFDVRQVAKQEQAKIQEAA